MIIILLFSLLLNSICFSVHPSPQNHASSVEEALEQFTKTEVLSEENQYRCESFAYISLVFFHPIYLLFLSICLSLSPSIHQLSQTELRP